jgi:hypothetical protein
MNNLLADKARAIAQAKLEGSCAGTVSRSLRMQMQSPGLWNRRLG